MDYKEFGENAHIVYTLYVKVNDIKTAKIEALSEAGLLEQLRKVDFAIANELKSQYEDLPESEDL